MTPSPKKLVEEILLCGSIVVDDDDLKSLLTLLQEAMQAIDNTRDVDGVLHGRFQGSGIVGKDCKKIIPEILS